MNRHWTGSYIFSLKSNHVLCTSDTNAPASFVVLWWIHSKKKNHLRNTINQMIGGYSVDFFFYRCLQCLKCSFMAWCSCYECHIIFWCVFLRTFSPHLYISCEITYIYLIWVKQTISTFQLTKRATLITLQPLHVMAASYILLCKPKPQRQNIPQNCNKYSRSQHFL